MKDEIIRIGTMPGYTFDCVARVHSPIGLCPTITTMGGGDRQPKIITRRPIRHQGVCIAHMAEVTVRIHEGSVNGKRESK